MRGSLLRQRFGHISHREIALHAQIFQWHANNRVEMFPSGYSGFCSKERNLNRSERMSQKLATTQNVSA